MRSANTKHREITAAGTGKHTPARLLAWSEKLSQAHSGAVLPVRFSKINVLSVQNQVFVEYNEVVL